MSEPQPVCSPNAPIAEPDHVNLAPESHVTDGGGGGADTPSQGDVATGEGQPASLIPSVTPQAEEMSEPQPICSPNAPIAEPDHVNLAPESHDSHVTDGGGGSGADTPSRGGVATGEGQPASLIPSATPQAELPKQPVTGEYLSLSNPPPPPASLLPSLPCPPIHPPPQPDAAPSKHGKKKRSHKLKKRSSQEHIVAGRTGMEVPVPLKQSGGTSANIESEISEIDSILQALNTGSFTSASMEQITQLTTSAQPTLQGPSTLAGGVVGVRGRSVSSEQSHDSTSSESSSSDSSEESGEEGGGVVIHSNHKKKEQEKEEDGGRRRKERGESCYSYPKTKGETNYRDLPPVESCDIPFPENGKLLPIGRVTHSTEQLLVIESLPNTPPVDEGTVLWTEAKTSIAKVFETFGPVRRPFYSIRVNSQEDLPALGIAVGGLVYVVPADLSLTKYVFPQELMKEKGSDASWKDDNEAPREYREFSDDENEQRARKGKRGSRSDRPQKHQSNTQNSSHPSPSSHPSSHSSHPSPSIPVDSKPTTPAQQSTMYTTDPKMQQYFIRDPSPQYSLPQYQGQPPPPFLHYLHNLPPTPAHTGPYPYRPLPPHSTAPPIMRGAYPHHPLIPRGHSYPNQHPSMFPHFPPSHQSPSPHSYPPPHLPPHPPPH